MATFSKVLLSGSANGKNIAIVQTVSPGTTIHTAVSGAVNLDEIWIYAINEDSANAILVFEYGDTTAVDKISVSIPTKSGLQLVFPGLLLQNGLILRAYTLSSLVTINGFVNRIIA